MMLLEIGNALDFLIIPLLLFWLIPIVMLIVGLTRLKSRPENAKMLLIVSGIWLVVGVGCCGGLVGIF